MTSLLLVAVVQTAVMATGGEATALPAKNYSDAQEMTTKTGKPLVIMVSTDWCPPCQTMKKTVMPSVRQHGFLRRVIFAMVNPDKEEKLAEEITGGGPIPQLVMYRKQGDDWVRTKLVGGQSVETVEEFIKDGLDQDAADKKAEGKKKAAPPKAEAAPAEGAQPDSKTAQKAEDRTASRDAADAVNHG
jgi:thiol-disulfide isomerase/thioredoxin